MISSFGDIGIEIMDFPPIILHMTHLNCPLNSNWMKKSNWLNKYSDMLFSERERDQVCWKLKDIVNANNPSIKIDVIGTYSSSTSKN